MNEKPQNYNLLEEPWIPVLRNDGQTDRVGIRGALTDAGRIRQIAASNPMDRVAILRFLLAVLYWCKGDPSDCDETDLGEGLPASWLTKLDANRECFNLLGEGKRFFQVRNVQRRRGVTDLIQEIPTGNNFWHFRHSTDEVQGLCAACCALGLLRLPLFSVSGLPDLKAGINGTPPVYVVPWGVSLLETLNVNWKSDADLGVPAWVQPDIHPVPGKNVPLLIGMTLLSRRVWLHDPMPPAERCLGCGAKETALIRTCEFQSAGSQQNDLWNDPHVLYSGETPRKVLKAPDLTRSGKFTMDRPWPDVFARIIETGRLRVDEKPISLLIVGFATHQAKNIDVWERTLIVRSPGAVPEAIASFIKRWQKEGASLAPRLRLSGDKRGVRKHKEIPPILGVIRPQVEHRVSAMASGLLSGGGDVWEHAAGEYRPMMAAIAKSLSPGFTSAAVKRRWQISSVAPNMRRPEEANTKPKRKGGKM